MHYLPAHPFKPLLNFPYHCCTFDVDQFEQTDFPKNNVVMPAKLANAVPKRRAEYLAGRICAHTALAQMGIEHVCVETAEDRAPIWPQNIIGSISHTQGIALAMTALEHQLQGLGIDIEKHMSRSQETKLKGQILHPLETGIHTTLEQYVPCPLTVIFSAKESIYKALYPSVKRFFGFEAAQLIDFDSQKLLFVITESLSPSVQKGMQVEVCYQLNEQLVLTECAFKSAQ